MYVIVYNLIQDFNVSVWWIFFCFYFARIVGCLCVRLFACNLNTLNNTHTITHTHTQHTHTHTHTHTFNSPFSGTTQVSRYQKGKINLDFTEARDSEWQWHQLGHVQVCTLLQTDNHASTPPLSFLQAGYPSCRPTNSVKALKAINTNNNTTTI